jgi:hypothetical protein
MCSKRTGERAPTVLHAGRIAAKSGGDSGTGCGVEDHATVEAEETAKPRLKKA